MTSDILTHADDETAEALERIAEHVKPTKYLLWFDAESTGLEWKTKDTVLEVAWTVTDERLRTLTPLRSRYTQLSPPEGLEGFGRPLPSGDDWHDRYDMQIVRDMHEKSGLTEDWLNVPGHAKLRSGAELERLILDDLYSVGVDSPQFHLAGAGVSHWDQGLLGGHCPRLAPTDAGGLLHYRTADTSVTMLTLGITLSEVELIERFARASDLRDKDGSYMLPTVQGSYGELDRGGLEKRAHRAKHDVAFSLVLARALRRAVPALTSLSE